VAIGATWIDVISHYESNNKLSDSSDRRKWRSDQSEMRGLKVVSWRCSTRVRSL